jgi:hypothetical protein
MIYITSLMLDSWRESRKDFFPNLSPLNRSGLKPNLMYIENFGYHH